MKRFPGKPAMATLGAAALALSLVACSGGGNAAPGGDGPDELTKISMHVYPGTLLSVPTFVGIEEGIFKKHGIELEPVSFPSGPEAVQALVSGGVDLVDTSPSVINITNEQRGSAVIKAVVGGIAGGLHYSIVGGPGVDWPDPSDQQAVLEALEDKTIGVTVVGADTQNVFAGLMELAGLDPTKADFVGVGIGASAVAAVTTGQVDAVVAAPPSGERIVDEGGITLIDFRTGGVHEAFEPFMQTNYFATEKWLQENEDAAHRLQKAFAESMEFIKDPANIDRVTEIFVGEGEGVDATAAKDWVERYIPLYTPMMSCAALQNVNDFYVNYTDTYKKSVACDDYFWSGASDYLAD